MSQAIACEITFEDGRRLEMEVVKGKWVIMLYDQEDNPLWLRHYVFRYRNRGKQEYERWQNV